MFSYTTGGPFGLEDMVTTSGPGMTLIYLLVLPFFWCIPVSLVSAELTTAMPVEGGFYRWTRAAFGDFWGFLAGWWNWSASFLLGGAYAVLFTDYLVYYFPKMTWWEHYLVSVALIAMLTWINVRGIAMVGQVATALEIFIFIPVMTMVVIGLPTGTTILSARGSRRIRQHSKFSAWDWPGIVAVLRIRATLDCRRRSREPTACLSARARAGRAAVDRRIFSAHICRAGLGGKLGEVAHRIFLRRRPHDRRPLAGHVDDSGGDGRQRRATQQHRADDNAHALRHGRRWISAGSPHPQAFALRHAMAGNRGVGCYLCFAGVAESR